MRKIAGPSSPDQTPEPPKEPDDSKVVLAGLALAGLGVAAVVTVSPAAQESRRSRQLRWVACRGWCPRLSEHSWCICGDRKGSKA